MSNHFGKIDLSSGTAQRADVGTGGISGVLIGAETGFTVIVTLEGANVTRTLYPGTVDFFELPPGSMFNGNVRLTPKSDLNNISSWPGAYALIDTFGINERPNGTYPMSLPRSMTTQGAAVGSIVNDQAQVGTQIVEATPTGDSVSAVVLTNAGVLTLGNSNHHGSISSDNGSFTTDGSGNVGFTSLKSQVAGENIAIFNDTGTFDAYGNACDVVSWGPLLTKAGLAMGFSYSVGNGVTKGLPFYVSQFVCSIFQQVAIQANQVTLNGSTAGQFFIQQPIAGTDLNVMICTFSSFRNNGGSTQFATPLRPMANRSFLITFDFPSAGANFKTGGSAGSNVNVKLITTLSSTGGTSTTVTTVHGFSFGVIDGAFDTIAFPSGDAANISSIMLIIGN